MSTMSNVNNVKCQSNFQNVNQIVTMSIKLSKCHSCKNVIQIVNMSIKLSNVTISNGMCYQSVQINLAHQLCTDFQYFYSGSSGTHSICVCTYCHNPTLALNGSGMAYEGPFKNIFGADHERQMTTKVQMISVRNVFIQ